MPTLVEFLRYSFKHLKNKKSRFLVIVKRLFL